MQTYDGPFGSGAAPAQRSVLFLAEQILSRSAPKIPRPGVAGDEQIMLP